jgi:hypothetical protein
MWGWVATFVRGRATPGAGVAGALVGACMVVM